MLQDKSRRQTYGFLQKISLARLPSLRSDKKLRLPWQHDGTTYFIIVSYAKIHSLKRPSKFVSEFSLMACPHWRRSRSRQNVAVDFLSPSTMSKSTFCRPPLFVARAGDKRSCWRQKSCRQQKVYGDFDLDASLNEP